MNDLLDAALDYCKKGYSVFPVRSIFDEKEKKYLKKPYVKWEALEKRLSTEKEIADWWHKWPDAMIGLVTGGISKMSVVDCDSPEAYAHICTMLPETFITPIASTPRGGQHLYFNSNGDQYRNKTAFLPKTDFRGEGGFIVAPPSRNIGGQFYQWLEGLEIGKVALQELPLQISTLLGGSGGVRERSNAEESDTTLDYKDYIILQDGRRADDLFKIGMALADGRYRRKELRQALDILGRNCNPPFPEDELKTTLESIFNRLATKDRNLADEVKEWCLLQKGYWNTTLLRHELHITTKIEIKNLSVIINRLQADGIIEKHGEQRGCYRTKDEKDNLEMRFIEGDIHEFDVKMPFGLSRIVSLYPKNIIIIAGSKSAGKTSLLLQIAKDNRKDHEVVYLNSEMGDEEWTVRLKKMGIFRKEDMGFKALGVHRNFHDMMDGSKKIYLVDYMEIHETFYEIAKPIRLIHETLKDGICFIAIQKKQGEELARGGEFSMEKSRLYLSLDFLKEQKCTRMTIVDAKSPKIPENIRGFNKRIKIIDGSHMETLDKDWVM